MVPSLLVIVLLNALFLMVIDCFTPHELAKADANTIESLQFVMVIGLLVYGSIVFECLNVS